ncbi:MAG: c-type cytochrome, partial [Planctomycetota bacterium]
NAAFVAAFGPSSPAVKIKLLRMAGRLGTDALEMEAAAIVEQLYDRLADMEASAEQRLSAARDLVGFRGTAAEPVEAILDSITPQTNPEDATKLLEAIGDSSSSQAGELLIDALPRLSPTVKLAALKTTLRRPAWVGSLLDAADTNQFDLDELTLAQKQSLRELPDAALRTRAEGILARGGGLPDADRERVLQSLLHLTEAKGNVPAGRAVFKKACANCHQHGDMGQKIGPNLTGMAVHPKDELLTHIIDPSRNVEGNFRMYKVLTLDGQVVNGMLAGESKTSITIVDSEARRIDLQREDIDLLTASRKSVMPEGFEKQLSEQELTDLLEFLTDAGSFVPIPMDDLATAISTKGLFHNGDAGPDRMVFSDWEPKVFRGVPFVLTDPAGKSKKNIVLLNGPYGSLPPKMPKSVGFDVGRPVAAIHMLSGVGGWSHPYNSDKTVSMIVRIEYRDGQIENRELKNAVHFADYIRRVDVPGSEFAYALGDQQIRYLKVSPKRNAPVKHIDLVKGDDNTAPIVMAITVEVASAQE